MSNEFGKFLGEWKFYVRVCVCASAHRSTPMKKKKCNSHVPALKLLNQNNRKRIFLSFFFSSFFLFTRWKSAILSYIFRSYFVRLVYLVAHRRYGNEIWSKFGTLIKLIG